MLYEIIGIVRLIPSLRPLSLQTTANSFPHQARPGNLAEVKE